MVPAPPGPFPPGPFPPGPVPAPPPPGPDGGGGAGGLTGGAGVLAGGAPPPVPPVNNLENHSESCGPTAPKPASKAAFRPFAMIGESSPQASPPK